MISHEPVGYVCPFCQWLAGNETEYNQTSDLVYQNELATAFIAPRWWVNNPGHILVIPNQHYENIYNITDSSLTEVYKVAKQMAIALKQAYGCDGTSMRQHNEPAGNQDVWHFHVHVYPRYRGDRLYQLHNEKHFVAAEDRAEYAKLVRETLINL